MRNSKPAIIMSALCKGVPIRVDTEYYIVLNIETSRVEYACDAKGNLSRTMEAACAATHSVSLLGGPGEMTLNRFIQICREMSDEEVAIVTANSVLSGFKK